MKEKGKLFAWLEENNFSISNWFTKKHLFGKNVLKFMAENGRAELYIHMYFADSYFSGNVLILFYKECNVDIIYIVRQCNDGKNFFSMLNQMITY